MNVSVLQKQCRWWFLLLTAVLAYSGLLFEYGLRLWSRDYFRFFPVYLIAVAGLTFKGFLALSFRQSQSGEFRHWEWDSVCWP